MTRFSCINRHRKVRVWIYIELGFQLGSLDGNKTVGHFGGDKGAKKIANISLSTTAVKPPIACWH